MNLSVRTYLMVSSNETYRLPNSKTKDLCIPRFANQRIRTAEVLVELEDRQPQRIVREVYYFMVFDQDGRYAPDLELAVAALEEYPRTSRAAPPATTNVIDGGRRFELAGGKWTPTADQESMVRKAALGQLKVPSIFTGKQ
jgi:hypothetical protein